MADVLGFFRKAFPFISTGLSLAGPAGNAAAGILGSVLQIDKPTPANVAAALQKATWSPELQEKMAEAEREYQALMTKAGYEHVEDLEKIAADDRASAREMQVQTRSRLPGVLAIVITVGFFGVLTFMLLRPIPVSGHDALLLILGTLAAAFGAVVTYYYGSSKGSADKTQLLAQAPPIPK